MIPGDSNYNSFRERLGESCELLEGVNDRGIHWAHRVENVAGNDDNVRAQFDHTIDRTTKRIRNIRFPLVDPCWGQPVVLPEAKMEVGKVDEAHTLI
jgi:hypothetical protein